MAFAEHTKQQIDSFFAAIAPLRDVYKTESFSYIAIKLKEQYCLVQGTLYLNTLAPSMPFGKFQSERVMVGHFMLQDANVSIENFVALAASGVVKTPHGELLFPPSNSGNYGARLVPFHEIGIQQQRRLSVLSIMGAETSNILHANQPDLDWEIRSTHEPFDGVQELINTYQPGSLEGVNRIDIAAFNPVAIDTSSVIIGENADIIVRATHHASKEKVRIGYRVLERGAVTRRGQIESGDINWTTDDATLMGRACLKVTKASIIHAYALYDGVVYHHYFVADPESFQNARRAAYEAFDPKTSIICDILDKSQGTRPESRDFEAMVPWLFWMLGFAPAFIGGPPRMRDAADFIMATPNGNIAVVECTVGLLKDNSKLPKLHDRTEAVRRNLTSSNMNHVQLLPIIVTAKSQEEIQPDIEQAEKLGIFVISRSDIEQMIESTLIPQDADQLYERAQQAVVDAKAKYTKSFS